MSNGDSNTKIIENSKSQYVEINLLVKLEHIIFNLTEENLNLSIEQTMKLLDPKFPYSCNLTICALVYHAFCSKINVNDLYLRYLELIQTKEEIQKIDPKILTVFKIQTFKPYYLIEKMISQNLIDKNITKNIFSPYFAHYKTERREIIKKNYYHPLYGSFFKNYDKLSKNNWELHKKYVREGHNPNEIAKIIRNDEIEKLQEISTQTNYDFNQTIEPSLYEICSLVNQKNVSLIYYAAFFSSVKCFKYLLMNNSKVEKTGKYAVAGGNEEIIHLCEQNHSSFEGSYETAIEFHKNDIFKYLYENKTQKIDSLEKLGRKCIFIIIMKFLLFY